MSDTNGASEGSLSMDEAVSLYEAPAEEETTTEIAEGAAPETVERPEAEELSEEDNNADPSEEETIGEGEDSEDADPQETESIDAPRSWTKEDKEIFKTLPRESQERLLKIDRARELEVRRGQNEAAERLRAAEAREQAADNARQQYEAALPSLLDTYTAQFQAEFQDIKTWDDVAKMQQADPVRFQEWQIAREKGEQLRQQTVAAQARQQQEWHQNFQAWVSAEDQKFQEIAPEFFDPDKGPKLQAQARDFFEEVGFSPDEIRAGGKGELSFSMRDHRFLAMARDAMRYRTAKAAVKTAPIKNAPPVQRPGTAQNKGTAQRDRSAEAMKKLSRSGSIHDALAVDF